MTGLTLLLSVLAARETLVEAIERAREERLPEPVPLERLGPWTGERLVEKTAGILDRIVG